MFPGRHLGPGRRSPQPSRAGTWWFTLRPISAMSRSTPWWRRTSSGYATFTRRRGWPACGRVVFASSGATIKSWEDYPPYDAIRDGRHDELAGGWPMVTKEMIRPRGLYGASKVWGEAVGRHYADAFGLSVICIRIGSVGDRDHPNTAKPSATYLSHRDVADILRRAIDAPDSLEYEIVYATSNNRYGYRDLEGAREVLGFVPQDTDEAAFE